MVYDGSFIYLAGVDAQLLVGDPNTDYVSVLNQLQAYRINKVRIWLDAWFEGASILHPWAHDPLTNRFDLDTWNPAYWKRLRTFLEAAQARNIIVEISLFDAYPGDNSSSGWWNSSSFRNAWNKAYNINNAFTTNASGGYYRPEFFSLNGTETSASGHNLLHYQQALVDRAIATTGPFSNVYFEIDNEFPGPGASQDQVYAWQQYWAHYVKQHSSKPVAAHAQNFSGKNMTGIQYYWDQPSVDDLDFHFYDQNPDNVSGYLHGAQLKNKILQSNESFGWITNNALDPALLDGDTREAWGWFTSGGYYAIYLGAHTDYPGWSTVATRLKILRDLVDKVQWWLMSPVDGSGNEYDTLVSQGPSSHWQILANPGSQYVVYFWDDGTTRPNTTSARIQLPSGNYAYSWYDLTNENLLASGTVSGGRATIPAPSLTWNANVGVLLFITQSESGALHCYGASVDAKLPAVEASHRARRTCRPNDRSGRQ
ncbi:MAG: hypothetical protein WBC04_10070 [Candidatus Acidiferrales bacterium]